MSLKPDTFLLITVTSGIFIIVIGLIIVLNCPLHALKCSWWISKFHTFRKTLFERKRKNKLRFSNNLASSENCKSYGVTLVEGRPQGHGFYTAGPWTSIDPTTTSVSIADATKMSLFLGSEPFSAMMMCPATPTTTDNNYSDSVSNTSRPFSIYSNFLSSNGVSNPGFHGDNSGAVMYPVDSQQTACVNCNGVGFVPIVGAAQVAESDESSYFADVDDDADADMIMIM